MSKKRKKTVKNIDKTETVEKPIKNRQKYRKTGKNVEKPRENRQNIKKTAKLSKNR